jgi:predicted Zn-dependent peptidase
MADLVLDDDLPEEAYSRRLELAAGDVESNGFDAWPSLERNARAILFGRSHPYGSFSYALARPSLDDLHALRERAFVPRASTLIVVGDISRDLAQREAEAQFGRWSDGPWVSASLQPPNAPEGGPAVVVVRRGHLSQILGVIAARGPSPTDPDEMAFSILSKVLGGATTSQAFHAVREDMAASYDPRARVEWSPGVSLLLLGGAFQHDQAIESLRVLLKLAGDAGDADISVDELAVAKRAALADWEGALSTDDGIVGLVAGRVPSGLPIYSIKDMSEQIAAVTAADVRAVARRYLSRPLLRVVLVGTISDISEAQSLGLGPVALADGFGRLCSTGMTLPGTDCSSGVGPKRFSTRLGE